MATLTTHGAVPGHHQQVARSLELGELSEFRHCGIGYAAVVEGWALYAETLGNDSSLYDDPYTRFGHLQFQARCAARLVVDTGIHALDWPRQRDYGFMVKRTGMERGSVNSEVDCYTSAPGQALACMIGELKIVELRARARARLGAGLDIRRFHNAVMDQGAVALDNQERVIADRTDQRWAERAK